MLFDLTCPCYLRTFSGKECLKREGYLCFFCPAYRSSPVPFFVLSINTNYPLFDLQPTIRADLNLTGCTILTLDSFFECAGS
jgi:hypothetical protein